MSRFDICIAHILAAEGGYVDHPSDRGGATNQGVTQHAYDRQRSRTGLPLQPVRFLLHDERDAIYRADYWDAAKCGLCAEPLDLVLFDAAVNHGHVKAVKMLQEILGVEPQSGLFGSLTTAAVQSADPQTLADALIERRRKLYANIVADDKSQAAFYHGWMNRLDKLETAIA